MKRERLGCAWAGYLALLLLFSTPVRAETSTLLGGSLLEEGEVAVSVGGGFPDIFVQFDFANSRSFNLALRGRLTYNLGLPFFGIYGAISAPIRFGILKPPASRFVRGNKPVVQEASPLTLSLQFDPGIQFIGLGGGSQGAPHAYLLAATLGVSVMMSYKLSSRWQLNFGVDVPLFITIEPGNSRNVVFGVNIPIEPVFGAEVELSENYSLFSRISAGPILYIGNMAANYTAFNVAASFSGRLWLGFTWRR